MASTPSESPPLFLPLVAHPLRWRLLCDLASSDRRVRELCASSGEQQSLVSYHLGRLRRVGAGATPRSAAGGSGSCRPGEARQTGATRTTCWIWSAAGSCSRTPDERFIRALSWIDRPR